MEKDTDKKFDISTVKFDEKGLVPAIAVDAETNEVLMQAYMNRESLELTLKNKKAYYFSRSRNKLWLKGETSGHFQHVVEVSADCDSDCILLRVIQDGAACHTGSYSCFFNHIATFEEKGNYSILKELENEIRDRKNNPQEGSYTNYLLGKGREKICKKVSEESGEIIIAAMKGDNSEMKCEIADLLYHLFVLCEDRGLEFSEVLSELKTRRKNERKRNY